MADIRLHHTQYQVRSRRHAGRTPDMALAHEHAVWHDLGTRQPVDQLICIAPMRGHFAPFESAGGVQDKRASADTRHPPELGQRQAQARHQVESRRGNARHAADDDRVVTLRFKLA